MSEPATVQACAGDLRTRPEQLAAAGEARSQFAETRQSAADSTGAKAAGRRPA
ncbi:hypothetical protein [Streptomyces longwoodensis]|uniref:hypothetical protein n=1 Tax=Streptomyces longwoodensis TaxID=68231 RepID=UPI00224E865B|nr:hypothetical protein [Streptomyces longwoodensis]MCX4993829.1 hypothetical protein [Streptomyces longwoodensis]MCX4998051.1 hypothetical protein [Streptomyces longwoodensis]